MPQPIADAPDRAWGHVLCGSCYGADYLGTVLSRTPATRSLVADCNHTVQAGDPAACNLCHSLSKSFE